MILKEISRNTALLKVVPLAYHSNGLGQLETNGTVVYNYGTETGRREIVREATNCQVELLLLIT